MSQNPNKRQSQPPALYIMFDTHFLFIFWNDVANNDLCCNHDKNEAKYCISNDILNGKITVNEIENAIRKAKNRKATGKDRFPLEIISSNNLAFVPMLEWLFNSIFERCSYPESWVDMVQPNYLKVVLKLILKTTAKSLSYLY